MSHALFRSPQRRPALTAAAVALVVVAATVPTVSRPAAAAPAVPGSPAAPPAALDCSIAQPDETAAMAAARACGRPVENAGARSETQDVVANPDGTWTAKIYAGPVRMRGATGDWTPIDLTMRAEANGQIAPVAHPGHLRLSGKAGAGEHELLSVEVGGERVGIGWTGALAEPVLDGNRATYPEVRPGVDLVVEASQTGVEQFFVVKNAAAAAGVASLQLPVLAPGLTSKSDGDGGLVFTDAKGKTVGTSPTPEMWDATIDPATGAPKRVAKVPVKQKARPAGGTDLTLSPAKDFFTDPATVYPVTVDPQINPLGVSFDTYVKEGDTVDRSGANDLQLGLTSGTIARSFIGWNTSALLGRQVTAATFNFYNWYSQSCTAAQWEVWTTDAATSATRWATQPAWRTKEVTSTATKGFSSSCQDGWVSVNGLTFLQHAVTANKSTAFMGLKATDETSTNSIGFKQFRSSQPSSSDQQGQQPYAVVTYNSYPDALDVTKLQPGDATETGTRTPEMKGVFSDPDGGTGRVDFEVYDRTGATLKTSGSGSTVSNGSESVWTVPSGKLDANTTYKWRARAHDGSLAGPWSAWRFMTTSDGSPTGEQRRFSFQDQNLTDRLKLRVNVANGNLLLQNTDLQIHGTGLDLTLDRYYNSRSTATSTLGKGWVLGTAQDVRLAFSKTDHATADITYSAPTGFTAKFINSASNTWSTPSSLDAKLTRSTTDGEFRLKFDKSEASFYFADSTGRLLRSVDKNKNKITFGYDGSGNVTTITDSQDRVTTLAYAAGRLASVTDPANRRVSYTYDGSQNLQTVTDAANGVTRFDYTDDRLTKITTPEGRVTNLGYEPDTSRMIDYFEQTNPGGSPDTARWTFTYSAGKTEITDPNGNSTGDTTDGITTHTYETRDRVTEVKDALGHKQGKKYNANDNVETLTDALTNTATVGWDPNSGNLSSVGIATGATSSLTYNNTTHPNSPTGSKDAQGNTMTYSYDAAGNKTGSESSQYPGQEIEESEYNADGTVKWREDATDVRTNYTYDAKGNLVKVDNPAPLGDIVVVPDALSRVGEQTDGKGQKTRYTYDQLDRVDTVTFQDGKVVDYDYDRDGNLVRLTDPSGITLLTYDRFGRPTGKQAPGATAIGYEYDRNGNLTRFTDAGGAVTYAYNQVNLLTSMQEPGASGPVTFTYDENNRRRYMYLPTSPRVTVEMKYDKAGRQTSITATNDATAAKLTSFSYVYAKSGADTALRQSVTDLTGTTTYGYDKLNRLATATGPGWSRSYGYDANYNRTTKTENGTTTAYGYNDAHELTTGGSTSYTYDANGNLTGSSSGWNLTYNTVNNQTTAITAPGKSVHQPLTYGGAEQTERRRAGSVTYATSALGVASATSLQPAGTITGAVGPDDVEPSPGTSSFYTRDNGGNLISLRANGARYYYLVDGQGSVVALVDTSATKVNSYTYDPYGVPLSASQQVANPWRYVSGFYDGPTGLTKFGARYYDAGLGRFTQRDPSGRDLSYAYAGCNPVNHSDPSGLDFQDIALAALAGCGAGLADAYLSALAIGLITGGNVAVSAAEEVVACLVVATMAALQAAGYQEQADQIADYKNIFDIVDLGTSIFG
ncbi:RHS repeat-associated core domain-containing protein [Actinoplanes sp. HUAS TT8]|uniref:RHS repeat-associated core domain-containing protein n=1 Tax=Actinoplanes sp. HUAS TT8 TaxID=3447453 RepID=UPI003F5245DD